MSIHVVLLTVVRDIRQDRLVGHYHGLLGEGIHVYIKSFVYAF